MSNASPPPEHIILASETMLGDLMTCVIELAKALPEPWQQLSETAQKNWISSVELQCESAITEAINIIASRGAVHTSATVDSVTFKNGGVKASLKIAHATEGAHQVADSAGQAVLITICDNQEFLGSGNKPEADPDQTEINLQEDAGNHGNP